jgi:DnaJ homolog subfamily C member 3
MRIFRLSYFLLPVSSSQSALSQLKQCLHYDPDSKECFSARRLAKSFDKSFEKLDKHLSEDNWKAVIDLLEREGFAAKFDEALEENASDKILGFPSWLQLLPPKQTSPRRENILRGLCKAYVRIGKPKEGEKWCRELGQMQGGAEDIDALIGKGEALLVDEEYEEAVRVMEKAWDAGGKGDKFVQQRLMRAQKLLKQSKQKDYYKVLGVSRDADQKTIKKA